MTGQLYNKHHHRVIKQSPEAALAGRVSKRQLGREEVHRAFRQQKTLKSDRKTGEVVLPNGSFRVPRERAGKRYTFTYDSVEREAFLLLRGQPETPLQPFETLRPFFWEDHSAKHGTGQLQKLYEVWHGRKRPNAEPGFGLPEVFQQLERLLGRPVPLCDREASKIQHFYAGRGPFPAQAFSGAVTKTLTALGNSRPLSTYLKHLSRLIDAIEKTGDRS